MEQEQEENRQWQKGGEAVVKNKNEEYTVTIELGEVYLYVHVKRSGSVDILYIWY